MYLCVRGLARRGQRGSRHALHAVFQAIKEMGNGCQLRFAAVNQIHVRPEVLAAGQGFDISANVFARRAHPGEFTIQAVMIHQMLQQQALDLGDQRRRQVHTGV